VPLRPLLPLPASSPGAKRSTANLVCRKASQFQLPTELLLGLQELRLPPRPLLLSLPLQVALLLVIPASAVPGHAPSVQRVSEASVPGLLAREHLLLLRAGTLPQ